MKTKIEAELTKDSKTQTNESLNIVVKEYFEKNPEHLAKLRVFGRRVHDFINKPEHLKALGVMQEKLNSFVNNPEYIAIARNITIKLSEINKTLSDPNVQKAFKLFLELPEKRRVAILSMSESGWFPFEESIKLVPSENESIDEYMIGIIESNYEDLKKKILEKYTERKAILTVAFDSIEAGNDIAAIPLLLTQIDGISQDNQGVYYFTGNTNSKKKFPVYLKEKAKEGWNEHTYNLFQSVVERANKTFISNRFEDIKGNIDKINILNRNGILHGDKDFLNYAEKPNAYKVLSLLLYVDWMSELLDEKDED